MNKDTRSYRPFYVHPYLNVTVVTAGTLMAVICWTLLFQMVADWMGELSCLIPAFVILVAGVTFLMVRAKHRKRRDTQ
jgi:hypothetical protein